MAYASLSDMERLFGEEEITELSDRDNDDVNDVGVIDGSLEDATDFMNTYLAIRYVTPLTSISESIIKACCQLARYDLHKDHATEQVSNDKKSVIAWLKDLSSGKAVLTDSEGVAVEVGKPSSGVKFSSNDRVFSDETLAHF